MARIDLSPGAAFTDARTTRRVVYSEGAIVVYSKGGDRLYRCNRDTFLRFRRKAIDVTNCTIAMSGDLLEESDDGDSGAGMVEAADGHRSGRDDVERDVSTGQAGRDAVGGAQAG